MSTKYKQNNISTLNRGPKGVNESSLFKVFLFSFCAGEEKFTLILDLLTPHSQDPYFCKSRKFILEICRKSK